MKKAKIYTLIAASALGLGLLAACSSSNSSTSSSSAKASSSVASSAAATSTDVFAGATAGTTDFDTLQKGFAANGAWLNAITADMDASGKTLTVDGVFVGDQQVGRKLGLYTQNANHQVTKSFTLTVGEIVANSPGFYISNGTVKGNVQVNAAGFHGQSGKDTAGKAVQPVIDGNLYFASQDLLDAYNTAIKADPTQAVKITGTTSVKAATAITVSKGLVTVGAHGNVTYVNKGTGSDVETGATAGTTNASTFTNALSTKGTWIVSVLSGNLDLSGKTVTVDGTFMGADNAIARKIALYNQNSNHQVTARATLTVGKLIVKSPQTYVANGTVKGDVYVAAGTGGHGLNFHAQNGKDTSGAMVQTTIDGNLYFASDADMTAYKALPAAQQFKVTGTIAVKATPAS